MQKNLIGIGRRGLLVGVTGMASLAAAGRSASPAFQLSPPLADTSTMGAAIYDVGRAGYIAEEFFLSGVADVYDSVTMADALDMNSRDPTADMSRRTFDRPVRQKDAPYLTRVVVYRPGPGMRASGRVWLETVHPSNGGHLAVFGFMNDVFLAAGDIHVSVQLPLTFASLRQSDPARYGRLQAVHPTQLWGMLRDTGLAIRAGLLLPAHNRADRIYMTGYSYTGVAAATFANFHHNSTRLANGRPVIDGYLPMANATYVRDLDVPVIRLNTQSDFATHGGIGNRKPDSDAPGGRFRLYEVPGASHVRKEAVWPGLLPPPPPLKHYLAPPNLPTNMGGCATNIPSGSGMDNLPLHHYVAAACDNLHAWVTKNVTPPHAARIEVTADGSTKFDALGNGLGGVRTVELDVPIATYGIESAERCILFGYTLPLGPTKLAALYGDHANYLAKVREATTAKVAQRWLRDREARYIVNTAEKVRWA